MQRTQHIASLIIVWFLFSLSPLASAVEPTLKASSEALTTSDIESLSLALEQTDQLTEEEQNSLSAQLGQAQSWINESQRYQQQFNALEKRVFNANARLNELKISQKKLANELKETQTLDLSHLPKEDLTQRLNIAESEFQQATQNFLSSEKELSQYLTIATHGTLQKSELQSRINQQQENMPASGADAIQDFHARIKSTRLKSSLQVLKISLKLINFQMDNLSILTQLAQTERDYWDIHKTHLLQTVDQLQTQLQSFKAEQAQEALQQSKSEQLDTTSPLYKIQQHIISFQQNKADLIQQEKLVDQKINAANEIITTLQAHFERDKQIVELDGSQETVAQVLHKRLERISELKISPSKALKIKDQLNTSVLNQLLLSEQLANIGDQNIENELKTLLQDKSKTLSDSEQMQLEQDFADLHDKLSQAGRELQTLYPVYISKLSELNAVTAQQQEKALAYTRFLNDHLFWLPNVEISGLFSMGAFSQSLHWFFAPEHLKALVKDSLAVISSETVRFTFWVLLIALLLLARQRFIQGISKTASLVLSIRTDSMLYSLQAIAYTLGLALLVPLILLGAAGVLNLLPSPSAYTEGFIKGLIDAGILIFIMDGLKQICRADGLAERHFRWHASVRNSLYRELSWATPFGAILIFIINMNTDSIAPAGQQMIGRLAFILMMLGLAVLFYRLWSSRSDIMRDFRLQTKNAKWPQLHFIWFPLLLAIPLALIWATVYGYYYSSLVIAERFNWTLGLILVVYILREILLRGLYLSERKIHYAERLQKRQALQAEQQESDKQNNSVTELPVIEEPEIDYDKLSNQVRQALNLGAVLVFLSGIWLLWSDVLPALNLISDSTLEMTKSQLINGIVQQVPLTLGDLTLGIALGAMTLLLSKDLPGLLEFTLLRFLPISSAARYATSSLTQYIVVIIGFVLIFRALGIEWTNIQWLVAALSVGLGFGLQEIVANFVSGIILLFEQPMRVGDIVTVDGVTGKVSKIRIRATTIVNWDRQELVIPNKHIITGQFINWSLSDPVTRVKVPVGIAYGSDVNQALHLIQQAAVEHSEVLKDPAPSVIFASFGDNALQLELRVFVEDLENYRMIRSELHSMINDKLNAANIVIAFPQQDVHLNTSEPLEIRLTKDNKATTPEE